MRRRHANEWFRAARLRARQPRTWRRLPCGGAAQAAQSARLRAGRGGVSRAAPAPQPALRAARLGVGAAGDAAPCLGCRRALGGGVAGDNARKLHCRGRHQSRPAPLLQDAALLAVALVIFVAAPAGLALAPWSVWSIARVAGSWQGIPVVM